MPLASSRLNFHERLNKASLGGHAIHQGETGAPIVALQLALMDLGALMPNSTAGGKKLPDGIFGKETAAVVKAFQKENGLDADAVVGPMTLNALDRAVIALSLQAQRRYVIDGMIDARNGGG